jgi:hypothetical protein
MITDFKYWLLEQEYFSLLERVLVLLSETDVMHMARGLDDEVTKMTMGKNGDHPAVKKDWTALIRAKVMAATKILPSDPNLDYVTSTVIGDMIKEFMTKPSWQEAIENVHKNATAAAQRALQSLPPETQENELPKKIAEETEKQMTYLINNFVGMRSKNALNTITGRKNMSGIQRHSIDDENSDMTNRIKGMATPDTYKGSIPSVEELYDLVKAQLEEDRADEPGKPAQKMLDFAIEILHDRMIEKMKLEELAVKYGKAQGYVYRALKMIYEATLQVAEEKIGNDAFTAAVRSNMPKEKPKAVASAEDTEV